ncbi:MAG: ATP-binding cassette domain-containing protein [Burkholderiales bacterium]|nr:ATP-binding cassette domain-containing protein [Burkholderiales bacterium]
MPETTDITLSAHHLTRRYGNALAVADLDLELKRGEVLGLLGPNGAGKSTTMQMLTGNLAPSSGSVRICDIDLLERPKLAKAKIGYLPETPPLYRELTVDEFLTFCGRLHRVPRDELPQAVKQTKARCGLNDMGRRLIAHLSKGYQQRVGIAQAILHRPDVVILDEPTVGLDPNQIREIRALIRELGGSHSVILSTHILPEVEAICDRVQIMHRGKIVFADSIDGLRRTRQMESLVVGFMRPPTLEALTAIPGVKDAQAMVNNLIRVVCHPDANPAEAITRTAAENNWGLTQLSPERTSLEDVFAQLTRQEDVA